MADPVDLLVPDIEAALADVSLSNVSVLDGPVASLKAPAVVIRPDSPWIVEGPSFCYDEQRYQAVMVVTASTPRDGRRMLYQIARAIRNALPEGWSWEEVRAPIIDESTGVPYLAAAIRLLYRSTEEEGS
jgi:hypothetical protein